jgi:hypothetical protein
VREEAKGVCSIPGLFWINLMLALRIHQSFRRINVTKAVRRCCQSKELMEANMIYLKDEWRGNDIFLLGTMHVSEESAKEVQRVRNSRFSVGLLTVNR